MDMMESKFGSGTFKGANASDISSDTVILERLSAIERMMENFNTILKENAKERRNGARPDAAFTNAWKIHKRDFTLMKEDMNKSLSDNKKIVHALARDVEKHIEVTEVKVEQLINQTSSKVTKQLKNFDDRCEVIQSGLSMTFEMYKVRINNDFGEFKYNTDRRLYGFHTDILTDECANSPCMNGATCVDGIRRYVCICNAGYEGINCQIETNECANNPCLNGATCVDEMNNYTCQCVAGYVGRNCDIIAYDCKALRDGGITKNGIYTVQLKSSGKFIQVYCDMKTDGGGWTVFQKRYININSVIGGSLDFNRSFTEYENGFGDLKEEFWIGLKFQQEMALLGPTEVRFDTPDLGYFVLRNWSLSSFNLYTLQYSVVAFTFSNADFTTDLMGNQFEALFGKDRCFSTYDRDCDGRGCTKRGGGWWYNGCDFTESNPNIRELSEKYYLTKMMLRRVQSHPI